MGIQSSFVSKFCSLGPVVKPQDDELGPQDDGDERKMTELSAPSLTDHTHAPPSFLLDPVVKLQYGASSDTNNAMPAQKPPD